MLMNKNIYPYLNKLIPAYSDYVKSVIQDYVNGTLYASGKHPSTMIICYRNFDIFEFNDYICSVCDWDDISYDWVDIIDPVPSENMFEDIFDQTIEYVSNNIKNPLLIEQCSCIYNEYITSDYLLDQIELVCENF